jgi:hypothetical protein
MDKSRSQNQPQDVDVSDDEYGEVSTRRIITERYLECLLEDYMRFRIRNERGVLILKPLRRLAICNLICGDPAPYRL